MPIGKTTSPEPITCEVDDLPAEIEATFERGNAKPYALNVITRGGIDGNDAIVIRLDEDEASALTRALAELPRADLRQREQARYHPDA